jgi:hypothetical protein
MTSAAIVSHGITWDHGGGWALGMSGNWDLGRQTGFYILGYVLRIFSNIPLFLVEHFRMPKWPAVISIVEYFN